MTRRLFDPVDAVTALGCRWSLDRDDYAAGRLDPAGIRCVLCGWAPCACPPFGTPEYFALIDYAHRKGPR